MTNEAVGSQARQGVEAFFPSASVLSQAAHQLAYLTALLHGFFVGDYFLVEFRMVPQQPFHARAPKIAFRFQAERFIQNLKSFAQAEEVLVLVVIFLDREQMVPLVEEEFLQGCPFFAPFGKPGQATDVIGYVEFGQGIAFTEGGFHPLQEYQEIGRRQGFVLVEDFPFGV